MSNHFRNKSCSWWRSIFNDLFRFSITTSNKLNFTFLCCFRFSFSNQIIFKQHLVIIINEYKFPLLTYSLEYFILYINPILDGSFILVFPKGVWEALQKFELILYQFLTIGYFRFHLGRVPFSSACFFSQATIISYPYVILNIQSRIFSPFMWSPFFWYKYFSWSHLSVTELSIFLDLFYLWLCGTKILIIRALAYQFN